jgi:hypothetical protein
MSKLFAIGLALMLGFAVAQPANAGHRYCRYYGGSYFPSYSYSNPGYAYGSNYATYYAPSAPAVASTLPPTPAPAAGQVAQSQNGVYRSFSDEPGQAAPAATYQAAPVTSFATPASNYGTAENPYGASPVAIGGTPSSGSNYGTAGNPYGGNSGISYGGGSGSGSTGGTAGHPY